MLLWMVGCGPRFLIQWSNCRDTEAKGEYQQKEEEIDDVEEEEELSDDVMEVEKKKSETKFL